MCAATDFENLLHGFTLQRRPYTSVADALDCQYKNFLRNTGLTSTEVAPFDFTLLKTQPDGDINFRWILGYDEEKFKHILLHKETFQKNAALVFSNIGNETSLERYYKEVLRNPEEHDDIEFLTGVFHLTYKFVVPKAFNIGLVHDAYNASKQPAYRARICLEQKYDAAEIPFLQIENMPPQPQVTKKFYERSYKPFEAFYQDWMYTIQGIHFTQNKYQYPHLLYLPIYDGEYPPRRAVRGYLGIFFSEERTRDDALDYFSPPNNALCKSINEAYMNGARNSILDSYNENGEIQDPIEHWKSDIHSLHHWRKIRLETQDTPDHGKVFWIENDLCKISIERVLERGQVTDFVDPCLKNAAVNKVLSLEVPKEIIPTNELSMKIPYIRKRMKDAILLLDELLKARKLMLNEEHLKNAHRKSAVTAVMARNLSHNIGSHVLARMYSKTDFFGDAEMFRKTDKRIMALNSFVRTRMDFLADLSTSRPGMGAAARIYRDVMGYFKPAYRDEGDLLWQEILLDRISGIDDLKAEEIIISYLSNGKPINLESPEFDPRFACPNGLLGMHALYIILENIIRNSAKHAFNRKTHSTLDLFFEVRDVPDKKHLIEVCISDRLGNAGSTVGSNGLQMRVPDYINMRIEESILDEQGNLRSLAWGVLEMKICAAYLRKISPEQLDGKHDPPLLEAVNIDGNLGYRFYLNRPKEVLIIDENRAFQWGDDLNARSRSNGVEVVDGAGFERALQSNIEHKFLVLARPSEALLESIRKNAKALPMRILTTGAQETELPACDEKLLRSFFNNPATGAHDFSQAMWRQWMTCKERRAALFIRPEDEPTASHWNVDGISESTIDIERIRHLEPKKKYVIYDRHGKINEEFGDILRDRIRKGQVLYYEQIQYKQPTHFLISNVSVSPNANQKIVYELIESGLVKIALFDERIQKAVEQLLGNDGSRANLLRRMNIYIPDKKEIDLDDPIHNIENMTAWMNEILPDATFFVIHLGILEKLYRDRYETMSLWMRQIEADFPQLHVILISGRGLPETIRRLQARFIQYSQVARHLLEERSKYHLCRALFAARRSSI